MGFYCNPYENELKMNLNEPGTKLVHFDIPIIRKPNGYFGLCCKPLFMRVSRIENNRLKTKNHVVILKTQKTRYRY